MPRFRSPARAAFVAAVGAALSLHAGPAAAESAAWSLADCLQAARTHNPRYLGLELGARAAEADRRAARDGYLPGVVLDAGYVGTSTYLAPGVALPNLGLIRNNAPNETRALLSLDQPLYAPALGAQLDRAIALSDAASADARAAGAQLALDVTTAYYRVLQASESVTVAQLSRDVLHAQAGAAAVRFRNGTVSRLDVRRAELADDNAQFDLTRAQGAYHAARHDLALAMGLTEPVPIRPLPAHRVPLAAFGFPDDAAFGRPELVAVRARWRAAEAEVAATRADALPSLRALASWGWDAPTTPSPSNTGWEAGVNLSVPLIAFGRVTGRAQAATLLAGQASTSVESTTLTLDEDLDGAQIAYDTAVGARTVAARAVAVALDNAQLARAGYAEGTVSNLELLLAEQALRQQRLQETTAYYDALIAGARLRWAAGELGR